MQSETKSANKKCNKQSAKEAVRSKSATSRQFVANICPQRLPTPPTRLATDITSRKRPVGPGIPHLLAAGVRSQTLPRNIYGKLSKEERAIVQESIVLACFIGS